MLRFQTVQKVHPKQYAKMETSAPPEGRAAHYPPEKGQSSTYKYYIYYLKGLVPREARHFVRSGFVNGAVYCFLLEIVVALELPAEGRACSRQLGSPSCPCLASKPRCRQLGTGSFPRPGHEHWPRITVLPLGRDNVQSTGGKRVRGCSYTPWVPARVRGSNVDPGHPSPRQGLPDISRTAASGCIVLAPCHEAGGDTSFCSRGTFQECQQGAGSVPACGKQHDPAAPGAALALGAQRTALPLGPWPRHRRSPPLTPCQPSKTKISLPCVCAG